MQSQVAYVYVRKSVPGIGKKVSPEIQWVPVYSLENLHSLLASSPQDVFFAAYINMSEDYDENYDIDHDTSAFRFVSTSSSACVYDSLLTPA
jgi:hypothetical protein